MASPNAIAGGMEKQVALQANALSLKQGTEIHVLAAPAYHALFNDRCHLHTIPCDLSRNNPRLLLKSLKSIRQIAPEIIHAHGNKAINILYRLHRFINKASIVGTVHGLKKPSKALAFLHARFAVSQGVAEQLTPLTTSIMPNAIELFDDQPLTRAEVASCFKLSPQKPILISVGRLVKVKAFDELMRACSHIDCNLLIFGDGPEREALSQLQTPSIILAGHHEHVRRFFPAADALIINSHKEGFGLTLVEALQQEVPVLAKPISLAQDVLPTNCILHAKNDIALGRELQAKLEQLPQLNLELRQTYERSRRDYSPSILAERLIDAYSLALKNHQSLEKGPSA